MGEKKRIYISSTFKDLQFVRSKLISRFGNDTLMQRYEFARIMEKMDGSGAEEDISDACLDAISSSDIYFIVIGYKYGSKPAGDDTFSYTEIEFDKAIEIEKRRKLIINRICPSSEYLQTKENDIDNKDEYYRFLNKVKKNREARLYDDPENIYNLVFDFLVEDFFRQQLFLRLNYNDFDLTKINRGDQMKRYENFTKTFTPPITVLPIFLFAHNEDMPEKMSTRLKIEMNINQQNEIIRNNNPGDENQLLRIVTVSLFGQRSDNCTFDLLNDYVKDFGIKSRFIEFEIDYNSDVLKILEDKLENELHWIKILSGFINRLNKGLEKFLHTIYIPIHVMFDLQKNEQINEEEAIGNLKKLFSLETNIKILELGVLDTVEKKYLHDWLSNFKLDDAGEIDDLINQVDKIFKYTNFPARYKDCNKILERK